MSRFAINAVAIVMLGIFLVFQNGKIINVSNVSGSLIKSSIKSSVVDIEVFHEPESLDIGSPVEQQAPNPTPARTFSPSCPLAVQQNRGIYAKNTSAAAVWDNVVFITGANTAYFDFLQNWEYLAGRLGLKWVVAAMDNHIYERLGPNRSFVADAQFAVEGFHEFKEKGFKTLSCNKLRMVLHVLEECQLDVVFSDSDVVLFKDPFSHQFGELIKSGDYDYIYQLNRGEANSSGTHIEMGEGAKHQDRLREGNTGFHYLSHKSGILKSVIQKVLYYAEQPSNKLDDQYLFWWRLKKRPMRVCHPKNRWALNDVAMQMNLTEGKFILSVCYLDPYYYPKGSDIPQLLGNMEQDMVLYHANFARGKQQKIEKMVGARRDGLGWNQSRIDYSRCDNPEIAKQSFNTSCL
jgi:hypothetical protein